MFKDREPLSRSKRRGWNTPFVGRDNGVVIDNRYWLVRTSMPTSEDAVIRVFDIAEGTLSQFVHLELNTSYSLAPELPDVTVAVSRFGKGVTTTRLHIAAPQHIPLIKEENYIQEYKDLLFGDPLPKK